MTAQQYVQVGGMSESRYGIDTLEKIKEEGLGNYTVLFRGPWHDDLLEEVAKFCRKNNYKFVMDEMINRLTGEIKAPYQSLDKNIIENYRDCFDGSLIMCEYGGLMLYWPEDYIKGSSIPLSFTDDFADAEEEMIERLKKIIEYAKQKKVITPMVCIEASGGVAKHLYKAGIDRVDLEVTYNPNNEFFYSAVKGATKAFDKNRFGVDMAMVWYGGNQHDELWFKRWKNSLFHAFIRGADPIYAEHGLMDYRALGKKFDNKHPKVKKFRDAIGELAEFAKNHPRLGAFPKAKIAVIHGNLDSFAALGQTHVWGQRHNDEMKNGSAEDSWELFNTFYERLPWEFRYKCGDSDCSGNPPFGQLDVIPAESSLELMQEYDSLIFLGWNTMTPELYEKLTGFVKNGGHLLATAAHLNCATSRKQAFSAINNGDIRELFGVSIDGESTENLSLGIKFKQNPSRGDYEFPLWSPDCDPKYCDGSFPMTRMKVHSAEILALGSEKFVDKDWSDKEIVLTGNQCGKGMAFLVNSLEYPGYPGVKNFYRDLLRFFNSAWQKDLKIECSDRVRYAVYEENSFYIVYILNTEENIQQEVLFTCCSNKKIPISLQAGALTAVYCKDNVIAIPENINDRITELTVKDKKAVYKTLKKQSESVLFYIDGKTTTGNNSRCRLQM